MGSCFLKYGEEGLLHVSLMVDDSEAPPHPTAPKQPRPAQCLTRALATLETRAYPCSHPDPAMPNA